MHYYNPRIVSFSLYVMHIQGAVGGIFFEYNDEPTKPIDQRTMGIVEFRIAVRLSLSLSLCNRYCTWYQRVHFSLTLTVRRDGLQQSVKRVGARPCRESECLGFCFFLAFASQLPQKDIIWNAVCCGTYQGVEFNMNAGCHFVLRVCVCVF